MDLTAIEAALAAGPTPGPWRWEVNFEHKRVHLVGGKPQYDLTVIDFERWGTQRATMRLRDLAHDGMNLMFKLHERPDWTAPFPGREHHASWCQGITHPDAAYIAACHPEAIRSLIARLREAEADARRLRIVATEAANKALIASTMPRQRDRDPLLREVYQMLQPDVVRRAIDAATKETP